ncbi:MAG: hypothetical protein QM778_38665 [Myxococcales bacterium]
MTSHSSWRLLQRVVNLTIALLVAVGLGSLWWMWQCSPRHQSGLVFVQVGPSVAQGGTAAQLLNLPFSSFSCGVDEPGAATVCTREFEGKPLQVSFHGEGVSCFAIYDGFQHACRPWIASRGCAERTVRIDDDLGLSPQRLAELRAGDPLSHMGEGDWGLPTWVAGLALGALGAWLAWRAMRRSRWPWRAGLTLVAFALGLASGIIGFIFWLFLLCYAD